MGRRWSVLLLLCLGFMRCRVLLRRGGICGGRSWICGRRRERDAVVLAMVGGLNVGLLGLHGGSCRLWSALLLLRLKNRQRVLLLLRLGRRWSVLLMRLGM